MALTTVADYVSTARVLLQDTVADYRYSDAELVEGLNRGVREMARIRPDLYFKSLRSGQSMDTYTTASQSTTVAVDQRYQSALLYYVVGLAQLRDDETTQDARSIALLNRFVSQLTTIAA
jgi:hypothetical protein